MKSHRRSAFITIALFALVARSATAAGVTLAWDANTDPDIAGYIVKYGDQPRDYTVSVDAGKVTTLKVDGLVNGKNYYFTILAYGTDGSSSVLASELPVLVGGLTPALSPAAQKGSRARLMAPLEGAENVTSAQIFRWEPIAHAEAYRLQIGTRPGSADVLNTGETMRTWWKAASLPATTRLFARIFAKVDGQWSSSQVQFVSAGKAMLVYPYLGTSDTSGYETFAWTAVTDAQAYRIDVGTTPDASDIVESGDIKATTFQVKGLQPGQTLHARVSTRVNGVWQADAVTFTTSFSARLTTPSADESGLGGSIAWTTIIGADAYSLRLGSRPGEQDLLNSGEVLNTETDTPSLPAGTEIFARLSTLHGGEWRHRDSSFTLAGAALKGPATGTTDTTAGSLGQLLTWTTISNAEGYSMYVGTAPGAKDLAETGELQATSYLLKNQPAGRTVYVSLWTKADGVWNGTSSTVTTR
jgi:hypothetical protein